LARVNNFSRFARRTVPRFTLGIVFSAASGRRSTDLNPGPLYECRMLNDKPDVAVRRMEGPFPASRHSRIHSFVILHSTLLVRQHQLQLALILRGDEHRATQRALALGGLARQDVPLERAAAQEFARGGPLDRFEAPLWVLSFGMI